MALRFDRVFGLADETTLLESLFLLDSQTESLLDGFSVDWGATEVPSMRSLFFYAHFLSLIYYRTQEMVHLLSPSLERQ